MISALQVVLQRLERGGEARVVGFEEPCVEHLQEARIHLGAAKRGRIASEIGVPSLALDCGANFTHQLLVIVQVVNRVEARAKDFADAVQVVQISTGKVAAVVTGALLIKRPLSPL